MRDEVRSVVSIGRMRPAGAALAAGIGALLGWLAVPNSVVAADSLDVRARVAAAAAIAAGVVAWLLADRAVERPAWVTVRLAAGTYLVGGVMLPATQVPFNVFSNLAWSPTDSTGFFGSFVPWIAAGSLLWIACVVTAEALTQSRSADAGGRPRISPWPGLVICAVVVLVLVVGT